MGMRMRVTRMVVITEVGILVVRAITELSMGISILGIGMES